MLEVRMLGPVEVSVDGEPVEIGSASQRLILAALGRQPGSVVSVETLAEMLWADNPPATAIATLQAYVSRLRRSTGSHRIVTHTGGYSLADAVTDLEAFEQLIEGDRIDLLEQALAMWRGEPYGEFADREPFRWDAHRLGEMYRAAQERHAELQLVDNPSRAAADLQALCRMEPLRERRWELLARALASDGRYAEALRALETARQALAEVGLEPSPTLAALADELLATPPSLPTRRGDGIRVPTRPSPLVGRQRELEDLARLLADRRLVTLVGPGGVGKTSLAQVAASAVEQFDGGVYWCELAPHGDRSALVPAVALAVDSPVVGDIESALIRHLQDRRALIVFDNCEHVIGEAARLAEVLSTRCPHLTMLATSREPLAIAAERVVEIRPLEGGSAAVELFIERAVAGGVAIDSIDRQAAKRVCELVDGLPLAVEMAAARVRSLGMTELTRRLTESMNVLGAPSRTANVRHRTLEAVVDWSADLLDPVQKTVLQRASVFAGGFDLEAAEAVIGYAPVEPDKVAGLLGHLIDRSLLTVDHLPDGLRYSMLDTIRWVASSWRTDPTDRLQRHHAEYYARLAETIGTQLLGPDEARWADRTAIELANLRFAVFGSLDGDASHLAVRICAGLHQFVYQRLRADVAAWSAHLFPLVERSGLPGVPTVAASAALGAVQKGDLELARSWCRRGRAASSAPTDLLALIEVECDIATYEGRYDDAVELSRELVEVARSTSSRSSEVAANAALALALAYTGHTDDALAVVVDMRDLVASTESDTSAAWSFYVEGEILLDREPDRAADLLDKAVVLARRTGAVFPEGVAGVSAASLRARHGDPGSARTRFAETIRRWNSTGDWVHQWVTLRNLAVLLDRLEDHEGAVVILGAVTGRVHPPHGEEAKRLEDLARSLRHRLGDEEYERLTEKGRRLSDNAVVDLALSRLTAPTGTTTLLITDIVGSTQLVGAIGDDAWLELLEWHNRTLHELIGAHGGGVVDRTGDGYLAMFTSPLHAVAGAIAIQRTFRQHRRETGFAPRLRIGVHHGRVTYEDGSPRGLEVHLTARIVDAAQPDEILASAALADEFGIDLSTRRQIDAKGIELPVEVGTVSW